MSSLKGREGGKKRGGKKGGRRKKKKKEECVEREIGRGEERSKKNGARREEIGSKWSMK